jgi:microcystin-dependent protein
MSYTIKFSDSAKINDPIVVEDATLGNAGLNRDATSLTFVGKNASGYAEAISTNFLHLLENFANNEPPRNPVEGQIWFDTSDENNKKLRINDGTAAGANWKPINGIYQQSGTPDGAVSGDIWVDTARAQLFLTLDGANWTLVGPSLSSELKTGSIPERIKDTAGNFHNIVTNYVDGNAVEIISYDSFTPQTKIDGIPTIQAGLNLTTANSAALNATAYAAKNIFVTSPSRAYVSGNSFVRNDIDNSINGKLNLKNGLTIGLDPTFELKKESTRENNFYNSFATENINDAGKFGFRILRDDLYNEVLTLEGSTYPPRVGINNVLPVKEFDLVGDALITGNLEVTGIFTVTNRAIFSNSITLATTATFNSTATFANGVFVGILNDAGTARDFVTPLTTNKYRIGTNSSTFYEIYSNRFIGNLTGAATSATQLTAVSDFNLEGEIISNKVGYRGIGGTYTMVTTLDSSAIENRNPLGTMVGEDEILVAVGGTNFTDIPARQGSGFGATFNVTRTSGAYTTATIVSTGTDYLVNDTIVLLGAALGGQNNVNNIEIEVSSINSQGSITGFTFPGPGGLASYPAVQGLNRASKSTLLADVYEFLIPAGTIMPFAGIELPNPPGGTWWLLCDGSTVDKSDYPNLFSAIGYTYGKTIIASQFKLPDLRGRFPLGFDDMNNGFSSSPGVAYRVAGANSPNSSQAFSGSTSTVTGGSEYAVQDDLAPIATFGGSTSSFYRSKVMNPYLAMNYIIKV